MVLKDLFINTHNQGTGNIKPKDKIKITFLT